MYVGSATIHGPEDDTSVGFILHLSDMDILSCHLSTSSLRVESLHLWGSRDRYVSIFLVLGYSFKYFWTHKTLLTVIIVISEHNNSLYDIWQYRFSQMNVWDRHSTALFVQKTRLIFESAPAYKRSRVLRQTNLFSSSFDNDYERKWLHSDFKGIIEPCDRAPSTTIILL